MFQLLLKGCTIEAPRRYKVEGLGECFSCCWKDVRLKPTTNWPLMVGTTFQLLLKGCTIEAETVITFKQQTSVSVVVERMYDWSFDNIFVDIELFGFSCCWKDVRLKPSRILHKSTQRIQFQLLLKGCTIEARPAQCFRLRSSFQLLLKGCTIEAIQQAAKSL